MKSVSAQASSYQRTGTLKSKRKDIDRSVFRDMSSSSIIFGAVSELYGRYSVEIWAFVAFSELALIIWNKLG